MKTYLIVISFFIWTNLFAEEKEIGLYNFNEVKLEMQTPKVSLNSKPLSKEAVATITKPHLIANASKKILFGYVKNDTEYKEFIDMYTKLLKDNDFKISEIKKEGEMVMITYFAHSQMAVRRFIDDDLNYNAKDDNEISKIMNETIAELEKNGMKVIGKYIVKTDFLRPTFMIYYLTEVKDFAEKEIRLRLLKKGEDIDFDLLENSVKIIRKDTSFSMLYIGKELGFVSKLATDEANAISKLNEYKKFLNDNNKQFINHKIKPLNEPFTSGDTTFKFLLNIYFFQ
ncbi:MAG: hypothetical protein K6357_05315 [Elusimicrobiota bacterium]